MMAFLRRIPLPMSALALGLAGLGNLLLPYSPSIRVACGVLAALVALLVVLRSAVDSARVREELRNPAILASFPTLFMALMVLATYLKPLAPTAAEALWLAALCVQLGVVVLFFVRFVVGFKRESVLPSWFLVFVGFVVASVTSPAFDMQSLGRLLLYAGLAGYAVTLPLVLSRVLQGPQLPTPLLPTLAIFAAPSSLCLVGYLAVTEAKQVGVVYTLLGFSLVSLVYVISCLPRILRTPFAPTYGALTFPFVIAGSAVKASAAFLAVAGSALRIPPAAVMALDVFAAAMVVYVLVRYAAFLIAPAGSAEGAIQPAKA